MNDRGEGWINFAIVALLVAGVMRIFDAVWMFRYHGSIPQRLQGALFGTTLSTYGWLYLSVGVILILAAVALPSGSEVARWVGITAAAIACVSAIWWMPYFPIWSLAYIILGTLVIYALAAYGGREASSL